MENNDYIICGIQQMGVGVPDVPAIWKWYRQYFNTDVRIFEEAAEAPLMIKYTGGKVQSRTATLAISMNGGGGFEIWQYTSRNTEKPTFEVKAGDLGFYATRIKCRDVKSYYTQCVNEKQDIVGTLQTAPNGSPHFFMRDPNGNLFNIVQSESWFSNTGHLCGGVAGALIGVSNIERSKKFYMELLGYDKVVYETNGNQNDLAALPGGNRGFKRVLLTHSIERIGPFSQLLGVTSIELIELQETGARKIFENRFWGDWGFIHLCFDVQKMEGLKAACQKAGYPFVIDSGDTFDMGEAGGRFSYIEDPDGALIEFVETHKVPVMKKWGWYLNLKKRKPGKRLPKWMLKAMALNRVKE